MHDQRITRLSATLVGICATLALSGCLRENNSSPPQTYSLSATVSGLNSSGLVLATNGSAVPVAANATSQILVSALPSGAEYAVTVMQQPAGETCTIAQGEGVIHSANVANVVITCSEQAYPLGGTISGLNGSGLVLAQGSDTLAVGPGASSFAMPTSVAYHSSYSVTVQTQPTGEACVVSNGTGTMPASAVSNAAVSCSSQPFSLGGTISGLGNNAGLVLTNGSDTLTVAAGSTSFTMPTPVNFGGAYSITVQASPATLTCTVSNASGTMPASNVTSVVVTCSVLSYSVGGTVSGLTSAGLVLANGDDSLSVNPGAPSFTMPAPVAYGSAYAVTVQTQPIGQTCSVSNSTGTMGTGGLSNVAVTCSVNTYTVGGSISRLTTSGLVLLNNGSDATGISANATQFSMNTGVAYGSAYAITVQTQPAGRVCQVTNGSGTVAAGDVTSVGIACGPNTAILYSFAGGSDGGNPYHSLIQASDGNFYGTTVNGGASNVGTIFKITPGGAGTVLYSFATASSPYSQVIQASDGSLYGTTAFGGANGTGTVFEVSPAGTETVLYTFPAGSSSPFTGVIQGSDGNFYGTTGYGSASDYGTVFKLTPGGIKTVLHTFAKTGSDGATPYAGLIQGRDGNFYGTTHDGGANGAGTVFQVTPSGTETVLYSFAGGSDGANPYAGVIQGSDGNLYGTTYNGGANGVGTVFKLTPSGTETVLYSFAGGSDGANPEAGVIQGRDGNFYGTTYNGGASNDGTVFKLTPGGTETILHVFAGGSSDGAHPPANLIQGSDGALYGTTSAGGTGNYGTFFKIALQ